MSRTDDGHNSLPFGNPFRLIFSRKSHLSSKYSVLLNDFEQLLARSLSSLKPKDPSEILGLSWMIQAAESLAEIHTNIKVLITDLQLPLSDWDNRWLDMYLNDSIKLLDICIALSSELSRLVPGQLLLQHVLHILDPASDSPSSEPLKRSCTSLHELIAWFESRSPNLDHGYNILQNLAETLYTGKPKNSSKGKVLMRALYGVKVQTIFICNIILTALSGCSKPLLQLHVPEKFFWSKAFNELNCTVLSEIQNHHSSKKKTFLKELEDVDICTGRLHASVCCNREDSEKVDGDRLRESVSDLAERAQKLFDGVDGLTSRVDDFFQIVLTGRDALLANIRVADDPR